MDNRKKTKNNSKPSPRAKRRRTMEPEVSGHCESGGMRVDRGEDRGEDEAVEGRHGDGATKCQADSDERHNYSITNRWRKRHATWSEWIKPLLSQDFDLNSLPPLPWEDLFMTSGNTSSLGKALTTFSTDLEKYKATVAQYRLEMERMKTEKTNLEAELETLSRRLDGNGKSLYGLGQSVLESSIGDTTALIEAKTALIETKMATIAAKTTRIADKTALIETKTATIAAKTARIAYSAEKVGNLIREISRAHGAMRNKFSFVKVKCNESLITESSQPVTLSSRIDLKMISPPSDYDAFFYPPKDDHFAKKLVDLLSPAERTALESFKEFVRNLFTNAVKTDDAAKVKATTDAILHWHSGAVVNATAGHYARPPTRRDREEKADQPILQAMICRIIGILAGNRTTHPPATNNRVRHEQEDGVTTEQSTDGSNFGKTRNRRIGITVSPGEENLALVLPPMMKEAIEIKSARDDSFGKFSKSLEKGRLKTVGHVAKRLLFAFDFGGVGKDATAFGVSLTHLSVEVIEMALERVGQKDVSMEMKTTGIAQLGIAPLTNKQKKLVSNDTDGILLLAGALKYRPPEQFETVVLSQVKPSEEVFPVGDIQYLGSGAFSDVVKLGDTGEFMKMPKEAALEEILKEEAAILRKLQSGKDESHLSIPKLVLDEEVSPSDISILRADIRGEISYMKGLRLRGVVGEPLDRLSRTFWSMHSIDIITTVYSALEFAHKKNIYHLDVRPGNIIVDARKDPQHGVMLSDWGCSVDSTTCKNNKLKSFRGCTPYAHDRLLGKPTKRALGADLDFASLTYTIHHVDTGKLEWDFQFDRPLNVTSANLKYRETLVRAWFEESSGLPLEIITVLKQATGTV